MIGRRGFVIAGSAVAAAALARERAEAQEREVRGARSPRAGYTREAASARGPGVIPEAQRVVTPNNVALPYRVVNGVKVFHLISEVIEHEFAPGLRASVWGYNGHMPGPTIEAVEGDRVRIYVTNRYPEATTVHWHGLFVPSSMDGVSGLSQRAIPTGSTYRYEFDLTRPGTFMYHSHYDEMTQIGLGATGMFVVHPRRGTHADRDFAIMLHEFSVPIGASRPNPLEMTEFNVLTMNGKSWPAVEPLVVRRGQRVRIRLGNLSPMDHHPIHLHGYAFRIVATDGGPVPESAQLLETTVLVPVGSTRDIELVADAPGDWAMHCHMTHHVMNQMGHRFPNTIGVDPQRLDRRIGSLLPGYMTMGADGMGSMAEMEMPRPDNSISMRGGPGPYGAIDMGGMFTVLKVREGITSYEDPGWYEPPEGTLAREATADELREDGIEVD